MAELLNNSFQELTPDMLKTQEGVNILNNIIKQLVDNVPSDLENVRIFKGYGTPESSVTAGIGSLYMRVDGAAGTSTYQKQSGTGNTGWVAVPGGSGSYSLNVQEQDGTPSVSDVIQIKVPNGTLTDNTGGSVSLAFGTGDVVGPSSATDNAVTRFDGTTGKLIQNSYILVSDDAKIQIPLAPVFANTGGIHFSSTSDPTAAGGDLEYNHSGDFFGSGVRVKDFLDVNKDVQFGSDGTIFPVMYLGGGTGSAVYKIQGNYTTNNASLRMLADEVWEFSSYLFAETMSIGASSVAGLTAAPANGLLIEGFNVEQAGSKTQDASFNKSNTTLSTVTSSSGDHSFQVTVTAGKWYTFEAKLFTDNDVTGGQKFAIGGTATAVSIIYNINAIDNATGTFVITSRQTSLGGSVGHSGSTASYVEINGTILVSAGGTLAVEFAQNVANGTSTVLTGSSFIVKQRYI